MKRNIRFGINTMLALMIVSMVLMGTASAKKDTIEEDSGNVSIQKIYTDATLTVNPQSGNLNTVFSFNAEAIYESDVYGIPIPNGFAFVQDVHYNGLHDPVVTGSSWANTDFTYKKDTPIGEAWHFEKVWTSIGGPITKHVDSHTWPKKTGNFNNRLYAWSGLFSDDTDYKTVLVS